MYLQSDEDFALACQTQMRPDEVKDKLKEAAYRLEETKHQMLEEFMSERDRFEGDITRIGVRFPPCFSRFDARISTRNHASLVSDIYI